MTSVATLRVQSLHITIDQYHAAESTIERHSLDHKPYVTETVKERDMLALFLAKNDPNGWTYLPQWALSPLQLRRKSIALAS